jgi:hypothetical protein
MLWRLPACAEHCGGKLRILGNFAVSVASKPALRIGDQEGNN